MYYAILHHSRRSPYTRKGDRVLAFEEKDERDSFAIFEVGADKISATEARGLVDSGTCEGFVVKRNGDLHRWDGSPVTVTASHSVPVAHYLMAALRDQEFGGWSVC